MKALRVTYEYKVHSGLGQRRSQWRLLEPQVLDLSGNLPSKGNDELRHQKWSSSPESWNSHTRFGNFEPFRCDGKFGRFCISIGSFWGIARGLPCMLNVSIEICSTNLNLKQILPSTKIGWTRIPIKMRYNKRIMIEEVSHFLAPLFRPFILFETHVGQLRPGCSKNGQGWTRSKLPNTKSIMAKNVNDHLEEQQVL